MKRIFITLTMIIAMMPLNLFADSYQKLWAEVDRLQERDLPKSSMEVLQKIIHKAERENRYGHLLKAQLMNAALQVEITPDTLPSVLHQLEAQAEHYAASQPALAAVYYSVLASMVDGYTGDEPEQFKSKAEYFRLSMQDPAMLARHKTRELEPMVESGADSKIFGNDLLSMLGYRAQAFQQMHDYYDQTGNRAASMITALEMARRSDFRKARTMEKGKPYIDLLDSLIARYGDLESCGEVACERYQFMDDCWDVKAEQKVAFIDMALQRWGSWKRTNELRNAREQITQPGFSASIERQQLPSGQPFVVKLSDVRNLQWLTMRLQRVELPGNHTLSLSDKKDLTTILDRRVGSVLKEQTLRYDDKKEWENSSDTIQMEGLPCGTYLLEFSSSDSGVATQRYFLYVSDLFVMVENLPDNRLRLAVVDVTTGQPVPGATVYAKSRTNYKKEYRDTTAVCDDQGEVVLTYDPRFQYNMFYPTTATDRSFRWQDVYASGYSYRENHSDRECFNIYTDRSIYRPGQTVHVSVLGYWVKDSWETGVLKQRPVELTLRNSNYKNVKTETVVLDEMGVGSVDFVLPTDGLTGTFSIRMANTGYMTTIRVEEYKRPTFELGFDPVEGAYAEGDTVELTGWAKSYAGVPVQGARVKYSVRREEAWWCWWMSRSSDSEELGSGEIETDDDGRFTVRVPMVLPQWEENSGMDRDDFYRTARFYNFHVEAQVTDQAGESHSGDTYVPLGSRPKAFYMDVAAKSERAKMKPVRFSLLNPAGKPLEGQVRFTIDGGEARTVQANAPIDLNATALSVGRHKLRAEVVEEEAISGAEGYVVPSYLVEEKEFILFDADDPTPCFETDDWFYQTDAVFPRDGGEVTLMVGTSAPRAHILYNVFAGDSILESGSIDKDGQLHLRRLAYREEYGSGLCLTFAWVKNGKMYSHSATIARPMPQKQLDIRWETFRDRLTPGQKEEWTLVVSHPDGTPAKAQFMAAMYDKSLDQIAPFAWSLGLPLAQWQPHTSWSSPQLRMLWMGQWKNLKPREVRLLELTRFSDDFSSLFYSNRWSHGVMLGGRPMLMARAKSANDFALQEVAMVTESSAMAFDVADGMEEDTEDGIMVDAPTEADMDAERSLDTSMQDVTARENLNETAFFYPTLMTDEKGRVKVKFTLPESLTSWKFMGLAHDEDMNNGQISAVSMAQKDLMVQPNMPRFVRQGDQATITTRIISTTDHDLRGKVSMLLIDPETEKAVYADNQTFAVETGKTVNATFRFAPEKLKSSEPLSMLICKIVATADGFSDGEQHYLPLLPNAELVTNTIPFTQTEPGTVSFDVTKLFGRNATQRRLTVEYTNNPAWLMVQSLPFVGNVNDRNAISLAAAYYANSIGKFILAQSETAKRVFEQWRQEKDGTSLMSALEQNQELKNLVLEETPWVMNAEREADQKRALATFFDENQLANNLSTALDRLKKLQRPDGSFSWWEGMEGSPSMTGQVMEFLTRLNMLTGTDPETAELLSRATRYLSDVVLKEVEDMKKREKQKKPVWLWSSHALQWVYINAITGRQLSAKEKAADDYLVGKLKKESRTQSMYSKALMAVTLHKRGERQLARDYVQSLKEYTVSTAEMGRYFDTPRASYSWCSYTIPTQVAAIEALQTVTPQDEPTIDEMKRWLLQEKRTQTWDTPISSVNAVYAFLNGRTSLLADQERTELRLNGRKMDLPKATAGLGYVKTTVSGDGAKTVEARKTSTGTSWGAIYGQALQPMTDIETADTAGLRVKREIILLGSEEGLTAPQKGSETTKNNGKTLADDGTPLHVGDRIRVRLTITAGRDYDYVQVLDRRAACMEPISQTSGYRWGYYTAPKDNATAYYFSMMPKGTHVVETDYYIDRSGTYETGTCTVQCAYSPEFSGRTRSRVIVVE